VYGERQRCPLHDPTTIGDRFKFRSNYWYGPNALPPIATNIIIEGNGSILAISSGITRLRFFYVGADPNNNPATRGFVTPGAGSLTLRNLQLSGGRQQGGNAFAGGGGAGMGGAIFNQGTLVLDRVTLSGNSATGGGSGSFGVGGDNHSGGGMGQDAGRAQGGGFGGPVTGAISGWLTWAGLSVGGPGSKGRAGGGAGFSHLMLAGNTPCQGGNGCTGSSGGSGGSIYYSSDFLSFESGPDGLAGFGGFGAGAAGEGSGGGGSSTGAQPGGNGGGFGAGGFSGNGAGGGGGGVGGGGGGGNWYGTYGGTQDATSKNGGAGGFGGGGGAMQIGDKSAPNGMFDIGGNGGFGGGGGGHRYTKALGFGGFGGGPGDPQGGGAGMGGAIFNHGGHVTIRNSTLTENQAIGGKARIGTHEDICCPGEAHGGAVFNLNGTVQITFSTIARNSVTTYAIVEENYDDYGGLIQYTNVDDYNNLHLLHVGAGGVYSLGYHARGGQTASLTISNSIVANNRLYALVPTGLLRVPEMRLLAEPRSRRPAGHEAPVTPTGADLVAIQPAVLAPDDTANLASASLTYQNQNIVGSVFTTIPSSNPNMMIPPTVTPVTGPAPLTSDPQLGALTLAYPTYFPLSSGSPAIDAGVCESGIATDQPGNIRPRGRSCDLGAYEAPGAFTGIGVNAGGPSYSDSSGQIWSADGGYSGTTGTFTTAHSISGTASPVLYQSERYGANFQYQFSVPNGTYMVTLKFAEIYWTHADQRVFNVTINGQPALSNFDIVRMAGPNAAIDWTFVVSNTGGQITIQFTGVVNNAKVSAIQIRSAS
jgi:hypothetical protein